MDNKYTFQGHTFSNEKQLIVAKKEAEAVAYLRSKTDFNNANMLMKLYNRILDQGMMETVIGLEFLTEIRTRLLNSGLFTEEQIRPVPEPKEVKKIVKRAEIEKRSRDKILLEQCRKQNTTLKIVCTFLGILVVVMFIITLSGTRSPLAIRYEEQILNKYASWAEELNAQEQYLRTYARELERLGHEVPEWTGIGTDYDVPQE